MNRSGEMVDGFASLVHRYVHVHSLSNQEGNGEKYMRMCHKPKMRQSWGRDMNISRDM